MIDNLFEIIMLLCFVSAWPFSIYKSYKSKSTKGKSLLFMIVILVGYLCGIANKYFMDQMNYVVFFYALGFGMVFVDLMFYFRNKRIENGLERVCVG